MVLLLCSFDVGEHVALVNFRALAGCHLNKLSAESGRYRHELAPRSLYVAEGITLGVLCSDVGLYRSHSLSGAAELLKTFLIEDREGHYDRAVRLFSCRKEADNGPEWMQELQALVFAAAAVKAGVVGRDPYEHGERRRLNLGHTFAHAIEHNARLAGDDITHGEAVSMGIILAARLSDRLAHQGGKNWCSACPDRAGCPRAEGMEARLRADFAAAGLPVDCPYPLAALAGAMEKDKKAGDGKVRFQIPVAVGRVEEAELDVADVINMLGAP